MRHHSTTYYSKAYFIVGFLYFIAIVASGQDQRIADSLRKDYESNKLAGIAKMKLLEDLAFNERSDLNLSLKYAEELIELAKVENNNLFLSKGYEQKGNALRLQGNFEQAIEAFFNGAEVSVNANSKINEGVANMQIADTYSQMGNSGNANIYYQKSINILRKTEDTISLATALINAGDEAFKTKNFAKAIDYFNESGELFKKGNYPIGTAYNLGNIGMVYAEQGKDSLAEDNINQAVAILEDLQDYYPISIYLTYMSDIYLRKNDFPTALDYAERSLDLAQSYGLKEQISDANLKLSELYEQRGDPAASYRYFRDHITYRDSVKNIEIVQKMADQRTEFEVGQKQAEVDLLNEQKRNQRIVTIATVIGLILVGFIAAGLYRRNKFIKKTNKIIAKERDRSDNLLLNILPEKTAEELKEHGKVKADSFDSVSVLFTDFKGFTKVSEKLSPELLVQSVDHYFSKFDEIMEKHGLEKIKTIGDAYMCAGGLPFPSDDHAERMIRAAREIVDFVNESKVNGEMDQAPFDIRIGINTGPVVAGVVGTKKFSYDIWGDTVNVASRMESNSEPGKINISENTYELVKDKFNCTFRGEIEVKNRGSLKMYFVDG